MSQNLRDYTKALYGFDHVMRLVPDKAWDRKSVCAGWTTRDVAGHAIGIIKTTDTAIRTGKMPRLNMANPGKVAGADPLKTWAKARESVLEALDHSGVLHQTIPTFFGEQQVDDAIGFALGDTLIHTWDVARSAKVHEQLDPALCKRVYDALKPMGAMLRQPNVFGDEVKAPKGADVQTKLLCFTGRQV